ncbi:MAG: putative rRNA maturation factor [Parcubacteria group bacterium Gr01-1014_66]|nr:MAG: putative rRNA maturation factor [Parcubacteria group bacterium Gr01-1014_66]
MIPMQDAITKKVMREEYLSMFRRLKHILPAAVAKRVPKTVMIVSVTSRQALFLNSRYRTQRHPANVLSFRYSSQYGEIILCPDRIVRDAKKEGNSHVFQMTWMILHGMLHLAGLHHEYSSAHSRSIELLERRVLRIFFDVAKRVTPYRRTRFRDFHGANRDRRAA